MERAATARRSGTDAEADRVMAVVASVVDDLRVGDSSTLRWTTDLVDEFSLDSLASVELQDRIEHRFAVRLPDEVLSTARTPADWWGAVVRARGQRPTSTASEPVERPQPRAPGSPWPQAADTLTAALAWHAREHPDLVGVRLLGEGGGPAPEDLTYGQLQSEATRCARGLLADGLHQGDRVAIMLPTGRAYFVVFMGALLAGGVPVPVYPPARLSVLESHLRRQALLLTNAGVTALVTVPEARPAARLLRGLVPSLRSVRTPAMLVDAGGITEPLPSVSAADIALIQYTSGSTGDPKGVVLTHTQLLASVRAMGRAAAVDSSDVFVSWLPLYHDMGLIGAWHAASLYFGMLLVVMSPLRFLSRPAAWLEAITQYRGTLSAAPNFGYEQCVDRVSDAERDRLDLSSWRLTFNGSEPVQPATIERFCHRFAPSGFRPEAMCPAYGLAEVGVGAAFSPLGRPPRIDTVARRELEYHARAHPVAPSDPRQVSFVSCGPPLPGYELRIVDEAGRGRPERCEGRVECRGPSATSGYFANERATRALWHDGWLDTGDAGYMVDGELFLTGRRTDVIIRAGRNLHPEELEPMLGQLEGLRPDAVTVFGAADPRRGTERLVVAAETEVHGQQEQEGLRRAIAARSLELLGIGPDDVVLVSPGSLLRTPGGKIRRGDNARAYVAARLGRRAPPAGVQLARLAWSGVAPAARRLHHRAGMLAYGAWVWMLVATIGVPLWLAMFIPAPVRVRWRLTRAAGRTLAAAAGIRVRVTGALAPDASPAIVVSNHPSFVDGLALLLALQEPVVFVSSTDFERQRLAGAFLRRLGCVFVHRDDPARTEPDVTRLVEIVRRGHSLAVFPEGSMTRRPGVRRFHLGAVAVATSTHRPVVPVGVRGTRDVVSPGSYLPRRAVVTVAFGPPMQGEGSAFTAQVEFADQVRRAVAALAEEPTSD